MDDHLRRTGKACIAVIILALLCCSVNPGLAGTSGFQEYLIPGQESLLRTNYAYIDNDPVVGNTMHCVISVTASTDGTVINYDHWENGYGTPDESYTLNTGQYKVFESGNIPANPRGTATFYDGGDRITVIGGPAFVSRASWPESPGTVMASAFEILPVQALSNSFEMPVGSDLYQSDRTKPFADFSRVALMIQSTRDNNLITVYNPDNSVLWTGTIDKGASVTDASLRTVQKGTRVTATYPVQIQFLNGLQVAGTGSQINGFTGVPTSLWGRRYAVAAASFQGSTNSVNSRTDIYLYNPNSTSITVSYQDSTSGTFTIAAKELASFALKTGHYVPRDYGVDLTGSNTFWGFGISGSGYDTWDWGFILMPKEYCRKSYVIGWAPGDLNKSTNYSAVFVMPFGAQSKIYVDYNQDGLVDNTYTASWPQVVRITDASDNDMTGARIWSPDTLSMNYGEISGTPTAVGSPALDLGYTILPLAEQFIDQVLSIEKGVNIDSIVVGHPAEFTLTVKTFSLLVGSIQVNDYMPKGWDYLPGSTTVTFSNGSTPVHPEPTLSGTVADGLTLLWNLGYVMNPNESLNVTFSIYPTSTAALGVTENCAEVQGSNSGNIFRPDGCEFIDNVLGATIGDRIWNDLNRDGIQDAGEPGLADVAVALYKSDGSLADSTLSNSDGLYTFANVIPGDYYLLFTAPFGYSFSTADQGGDDGRDSDVNPATARTVTTTLSSDESDLSWDAGLYLLMASIDIEKFTNGEDADSEPGPVIILGGAVTWRYQVSNTGNVPLSSIAVTDSDPNVHPMLIFGDLNSDQILDLNEIWIYEAVGAAAAGQYVNTGTATGQYNGSTFQDSDVSHYYTEGRMDFGDAPDPTYPTLLASDGARHILSALFLGSQIDTEADGQPAGSDDDNGAADDEDGVIFSGAIYPGQTAAVAVTASADGILNAWLDFNGDGDWSDEGEQIFADRSLTAGANALSFAVPATAQPGSTWARFRLSSASGLSWTGLAMDGEVEDHSAMITGLANIGEVIWQDLNRNGIQDAGEPGLADVAVALHKIDGTLVGSLLSNSDGRYRFINLIPGDYYLHFTAPAEYGFTRANQGGDDNLDSDADPATGRTATMTLAPGENQLIWDVGFYPFVASIQLEKLTNGDNADLPTGPSVPVGSAITWSYQVSNPGDVALADIHVTDSDAGVTPVYVSGDDGDGLLQPSETWIYRASSTAVAGQYQNIGSVSGVYEDQTISDTDPSHYFGGQAAIEINKATNGEDADELPGPNITPGTPVAWSYVITNQGNIPIGNILVTDSETGVTPVYVSGDDGDGLLQPGETWAYQATGTAQPGQYGNVGTVYGVDTYGQPVTDSDASHYFGPSPSLHIEKLTNGQDADLPIGPAIVVGQPVVWSYIITNTGNVGLEGIAVTDDHESQIQQVDTTPADGFNDGDLDLDHVLDPNETWTFTASGVAMAGQYANTGTVSGTFNGQTVTDTDPSHYFGGNGAVEIEKSTNGLDADSEPGPGIITGSPVEWRYHVRNIGNTPIRDLVVSDDQGVTPVAVDAAPADGYNDGDANLDGVLDTNEIWEFVAAGTAQPGQYGNIGSVSAIDALTGQTLTDEDPSHYFGATPGIDIEKFTNGEDADSEPGPAIILGGIATWRYQVSNTGNVPLSSIAVTDSDPNVHPMLIFGDLNSNQILDLNEIWIYEAADAAAAGQYANTGTATGQYNGSTFQDSDVSHYYTEGRMDFGDAPDPTYPTLLASDGARHILSALFLGSQIDTEADGMASGSELGDDLDGIDDEDGIQFPSLPFIQNSQNEVIAISSGAGYLNAWIDFNRDGDWIDEGEKILSDRPVAAGSQSILFQVPNFDPNAAPETRAMNARFRLSSQPGLGIIGMAMDGEVEDYQVAVYVPVELNSFTATAVKGAVKLAWTTQSETENLGFYLFRSETEDGQYERITSQILPGAGSSTAMHSYKHTDINVAPGRKYYYKLADVSLGGAMHLHQSVQVTVQPAEYSLEQNYPNPFNPETNIRFTIKEAGEVSLMVVNMQGQIVRTLASGRLDAGAHEAKWDARNDAGIQMPSGNYLCILKAKGFSKSMHMTLLK